MQLVSTGDNLHEIPKPVFWEKIEKYFNMLSAENFTQNAERSPNLDWINSPHCYIYLKSQTSILGM